MCNCCCECSLCGPAMHVWDVRSCTISYDTWRRDIAR